LPTTDFGSPWVLSWRLVIVVLDAPISSYTCALPSSQLECYFTASQNYFNVPRLDQWTSRDKMDPSCHFMIKETKLLRTQTHIYIESHFSLISHILYIPC